MDKFSPAQGHVPVLDGLRGWAALFVLLAHAQILSHCKTLPFERIGIRAVDIFLLLSGYLLAYHGCRQRDAEPWRLPSTWGRFWVRRYFRIAPAYGVMVSLALLLTPLFVWARTHLAGVWPGIVNEALRYQPTTLGTYLGHLSFYFAFQPVHQYSTVIPNWTVALEIQFYLVFPLLMLLFDRWGAALAGALAIGVGWLLLHNRLQNAEPGFVIVLLKSLHLFVIGMWAAFGKASQRLGRFALASAAVLVLSLPFDGKAVVLERLVCVVLFYALLDTGGLRLPAAGQRGLEALRLVLRGRLSAHLGATSYGVFLTHPILLLPLAAVLAHSDAYLNADGRLRFLVCVLVVIGPVYAAADLLHRWVEGPCIRLGRRLAQRLS